jgi:beta-glucosidase-like glycosyl hydrolase/CubicO group peptidase (beta-lactamase class C family)
MRSPILLMLLSGLLSCRTVTLPLAPVRTAESTAPAQRTPAEPAWSGPGGIDSLLATLTLEEKAAQMVMVRVYGYYFSTDSDVFERCEHLVADRKVGGIIMAQGDVVEEALLINHLQRLARIPLLVAADYERGIAMRIRRGTSFPDAMAMGATRRTELAYRAGKAIGLEARALGIHQNYAPVADVNNNPLNPVINTRAFGSDVALVRDMAAAFTRGTEDAGVIATVKHFPGHGDTGTDSHLDLPVLDLSRSRLDSVEFPPFRGTIDAGVGSVMVSHLAIPSLDSTRVPASLSHPMIDGVLRREMGFRGLVVTDAMEMQGVTRKFTTAEAAVRAIRAGIDILLIPPDEDAAIAAIVRGVRDSVLTMEQINGSVRRILAAKKKLGLDTARFVDIEQIPAKVGTRVNRNLSKEIARESITILRNTGGLLPLLPNGTRRVVAVLLSDTEENRSEINRPWTPGTTEPYGAYFSQLLRRRLSRVEIVRLTPGSDPGELDAALGKIKRADVVLYCLYVKVRTATGRIELPEYARAFCARAEQYRPPAAVLAFGNPYLVGQFPRAQSLLCAYGDNETSTEAAVEALFGEIPVRGKFPVAVPGEFAYGSGLDMPQTQLRRDEPSLAGFDREELQHVEEIVLRGIADSAYPGAQLAIVKDGLLVYSKAFGSQTYDPDAPEITGETMYDVASMTKVVATTSSLMRLYDQKKFSLDDPVAKYLPQFSSDDKRGITIRHLLLHRGGFPPFRQLWKFCPDPASALDSVYGTALVARPGDTTIYSDLGMITLGKVVEKLAGISLDAYFKREFAEPLHLTNTMFRPDTSLYGRIAPTEVDSAWRRALVRGVVHDENACFLGGVSGHAGLFSTAPDLAVFAQMLLNRGTYGGRRYISEGTMYEFLSRRQEGQERWLGWDMRSPRGSSAGSLFSPSSFGHTGFTGTSIWMDPDRSLAVVFLTNRVHPTRANTRLLKIRPVLHDAVIHALGPFGGRP